jgi:hypothetical protein
MQSSKAACSAAPCKCSRVASNSPHSH